jgi:protein KRI1
MGKKKAAKTVAETAEKRALLPAEGGEDVDTVEDAGGLRVNAAFARAFEARKRKEELSSLSRRRAAYDNEEEEDSESETEDEDGEELTAELDADIRQTLRLIRRRDPAIYDPAVAFFKAGNDDEEEEGGKREKKPKKDAPLYYKDLVRRQAVAGDVASDESDAEEEKEGVLTFREEQDKLRQEFLASVGKADGDENGDDDDSEDEGEGGLFTVRKKSVGEQAEEDADMAQFTSKYGSKLKAAEVDPDAFLEHYLSSEGWKDKSAAVPHYEDIVRDDEEDAEALDKAENFEHAYNFRFEEEGGGVIQTYARNVEDSMRRVDDARKRKREERKTRKALERQKKEEELRRLKNLKQAEIQAKLDKVARLMGDKAEQPSEAQRLAALADDLDADFDPDAYDKKMQAIFDDEYYQEGDDGAVDKPEWDDDEDKALFAGLPVDPDEEEEEEEEEEKEEKEQQKVEEEDEDEEAADEQEPEEDDDEEEGEQDDEPALENMTVEEMKRAKQKYLDELYSLDYEDLIGDLKCRFKYTQVRDNDFGLTVDEIMTADDKELKQLVALKRLAPYVEDEFLVDRKKLKRFRKTLEQERREKEEAREAKAKRKLEAAAEQGAAADAEDKPKKKRKRSKKKDQQAVSENKEAGEKKDQPTDADAGADKVEDKGEVEAEGKKKRRGKKSKGKAKDTKAFAATGLSTSRLESYKLVKSKS